MNAIMTGSAAPIVSIVIRAYNEQKHIERLLEGILEQNLYQKQPRQVEIILVDSGSTDASLAIASRFPVQIVHISPDEFSFGRSLNRGIEQARAEFTVIASAHVYPVYPDWLEHLLAPFQDAQVALVYGKQRGNAATHFSERQVFARWFPEVSIPRQSHPFCNNANAAIRRSLWQQRPYDESLSGLEDLDWAHWAMEQGHTISYSAEAEIIHVHSETPAAVFNRYRREAMAFKRIFPQEHFQLWDFVRLFTSNAAADLLRSARQGKDVSLLSTTRQILWFRWMQFWGTYQGYRQSGPLTSQLRQTFYYPQGIQTAVKETRDVEPIQYRS
jgi:glycosyltransferase involved in cell wall biosynthesis